MNVSRPGTVDCSLDRETGQNFFKSYPERLAALCRDQEYALKVIGKYARINDRDILLESYRTSVPQIPTQPYVRREIVKKSLTLSKHTAARGAESENFTTAASLNRSMTQVF